MLRFSHKTGLLVNLMDTRGGLSVRPGQPEPDPSTATSQGPASTSTPQPGPLADCDDQEDDSLSITEGEFLVIDEVIPLETDEKIESRESDVTESAPVSASAEPDGSTEEAAPALEAKAAAAQKVDTLAEATKEFFKSHPLDVMELQLRQLIPSPSKRYIRMHCRPENGTLLHQMPVDDCNPQQDDQNLAPPTKNSTPSSAPPPEPPAPMPGPAGPAPTSAPQMSELLEQGSSSRNQTGYSGGGSYTATQPQQLYQSASYQTHRYYSHQQPPSVFYYYGLTHPYSSRYMQHREDRYQPYPGYSPVRTKVSDYCQPYQQQQTSAAGPSTAVQPQLRIATKLGGQARSQHPRFAGNSATKSPSPALLPPPPQPPLQQHQKLPKQPQLRKQSLTSGRGRGRRSGITGSEPRQTVQLDDSHGRQQWLCSLCGIGFPDSCLYGLHRQFHDQQNAWQCSACGYQACGVYDFNQHLVQLPHPLPAALNCINGRKLLNGAAQQ